MNPMIRREIRQRMRERRAWVLPSVYLLVLTSIVLFSYYLYGDPKGPSGPRHDYQGADIGTMVFVVTAYCQLAILMVIVPAFGATAITMEKEQRTLAALLTSLLTPVQIWWGKFVAALMFQAVLLASALPVMAMAFSFGGMGIREVVVATVTTLVILASFTSVALCCSSYFRRSAHATAVTQAVVIGLTVVTAVVAGLLSVGPKKEVVWPMLLNPFYALTAGIFNTPDRSGAWLTSALLFITLGALAAVLTVRNLSQNRDHA